MQKYEIISLIFLATAYTTIKGPATMGKISETSDGINHSVPTNHELQLSFSWLGNNFVSRLFQEYQLTEKGKESFVHTQQKTLAITEMREELNLEFEKLNNQH